MQGLGMIIILHRSSSFFTCDSLRLSFAGAINLKGKKWGARVDELVMGDVVSFLACDVNLNSLVIKTAEYETCIGS